MGGFSRLTNQGGSQRGPYWPRNKVIFENFNTVPYAYIPEVLEATLGDIEVSEGRL